MKPITTTILLSGIVAALAACSDEAPQSPSPAPASFDVVVLDAVPDRVVAGASLFFELVDGSIVEVVTDEDGTAEVSAALSDVATAIAYKEGYVFDARTGAALRHVAGNMGEPAFVLMPLEAPDDPTVRLYGAARNLMWDSGNELLVVDAALLVVNRVQTCTLLDEPAAGYCGAYTLTRGMIVSP